MGDVNRVNDFTAEFRRFLPVFAPVGEPVVTELRALGVPGWKPGIKATDECGFFDLENQVGRTAVYEVIKKYVAQPLKEQPEGIYFIINPVDPVFLARANNCMGKKGELISADDKRIRRRRWLPVDADPTKPISKISATDAEKAAARLLIDGVREDMRARGFCEPMLCDSGNGFHLWYKIDLPLDDGGLVEHVLKDLADRHNSAGATVDTKLFNASRILKIPGTWARKGCETADRPYRMARVLEVPQIGVSSCAK